MVNVTAVHMNSGGQYQHIASVRWTNPENGVGGESTRQDMVDFIRNDGVVKVHGTDGSVSTVGVIDATPPYIRTHADGSWNDNLLALPRY